MRSGRRASDRSNDDRKMTPDAAAEEGKIFNSCRKRTANRIQPKPQHQLSWIASK